VGCAAARLPSAAYHSVAGLVVCRFEWAVLYDESPQNIGVYETSIDMAFVVTDLRVAIAASGLEIVDDHPVSFAWV
jgi:hypothetical protein